MEEMIKGHPESDFKAEKDHLAECLTVIRRNIANYEEQLAINKAETKELYDNYRSGDSELHNELVTGLDWQKQLERTVQKNHLAEERPYFGRIDYEEHHEQSISERYYIGRNGILQKRRGADDNKPGNEKFSIYIGKNGIMKDTSNVLIVDWRAPVASVYYDSDIGKCSYSSPDGSSIEIDLQKKRTYEIENSQLIDYYDTEVIANDEFLTKYLAKNKEVVLGEIIATIQKEQNLIIRDTPWHSVIVQGVAGSGKTTVAMHRISYLLYNYKTKLRQEEFYIIGSNKTLLNYITGVLPNLDVYFVKQMTMAEFFKSILAKDFTEKKGKYSDTDILKTANTAGYKQFKGSLEFVRLMEEFLDKYQYEMIPVADVHYHNRIIYREEDIRQLIASFPMFPAQEKIDMLNKRIVNKVKMVLENEEAEKEDIKEEVRKIKDYFGKKNKKLDIVDIYVKFLTMLSVKGMTDSAENPADNNMSDNRAGGFLEIKEAARFILSEIMDKRYDIYDYAMMALIKKRLRVSDDFDFVSHIVIDEAQDFGVSIFAVLRKLFKECQYTIMGDVSQNIYYDTGMNDWKALRSIVFDDNKDKFYLLAKSYRNTVEISDYASAVLKKCTFETYDIEPIIRHGNPVGINIMTNEEGCVKKCVELIGRFKAEGYDTTAVICHDMEEARRVEGLLKEQAEVVPLAEDVSEIKFVNGVMVLPVHLTKGLEFDSVILWKPVEKNYPVNDANAKLLYVAITRALHECELVADEELSGLLKV